MKRCLILSLLIVVLCSIFVLAEDTTTDSGFNEEASYAWLKEKTADWSSMSEIHTISLSMLALINHGDDVSGGVSKLNSMQDSMYCWPKGGCKVDDTALATLALSKAGQDVTKSLEWLEDVKGALNPALSTGTWNIQIEAAGTGTCVITYSNNQTQNVVIEENGASVDISAKVKSKVLEKIKADCSNLQGSGSIIISLVYRTGNNFYILQNERVSSLDINVANGCYGTTLTSTGCDFLSTAYASWALYELERPILTDAYLESVLETQFPADLLKHALVARINGKESYMTFLDGAQGSDGSWSAGKVLDTAWAVFALSRSSANEDVQANQDGLNYLKRIVSAKGHWNNNVKDTALALIAINGKDLSGSSPIIISKCTSDFDCTSGVCNLTSGDCETAPCVDDMVCDASEDCTCTDCISDTRCITTSTCVDDAVCDASEECTCIDCVNDARCLTTTGCVEDGYCDSYSEGCDCADCSSDLEMCPPASEGGCTDDGECNDDEKCVEGSCVVKKGFPWWILIVILLLAGLGFGGWWLVKTGKLDIDKITGIFSKKKKQPKQPSFAEYARARPIQPMQQPRYLQPKQELGKKSKEDLELEKSLKEAEKLLYGK